MFAAIPFETTCILQCGNPLCKSVYNYSTKFSYLRDISRKMNTFTLVFTCKKCVLKIKSKYLKMFNINSINYFANFAK